MKSLLGKFILGLITGAVLSFSLVAVSSPGEETRNETLFVYGTLTNPAIRVYACWCLTGAEPASLDGYSKEGLNIIANEETEVQGELIKLSPTELARIDRYEDTPENYQRIRVEVNGESVWVYQKKSTY